MTGADITNATAGNLVLLIGAAIGLGMIAGATITWIALKVLA